MLYVMDVKLHNENVPTNSPSSLHGVQSRKELVLCLSDTEIFLLFGNNEHQIILYYSDKTSRC